MPDIYSEKKRSQIMSHISGKETKPEIIVRKYLFSKGFRYRKNDKRYPGTPDIVIPKYSTIVFLHGCFWHCHKCKRGKLPETRKNFWRNKISATKKRDKSNQKKLEHDGWKVITVWQCEIKNQSVRTKRLNKLVQQIKDNS